MSSRISSASARSYVRWLLAQADYRDEPRLLTDELWTALSDDDSTRAYYERDGTMAQSLLILPTLSHASFCGVVDVNGRPLREGLSQPELREDVESQMHECPYAGSRHRHEKPMNLTALRIAGTRWKPLLQYMHLMRELYIDAYDVDEFDLYDAFRVAQMLESMPAWTTYRAKDPIGTGEHSPLVATWYKGALGLVAALSPVVFDHVWRTMRDEEPSRPTPGELYEHADTGLSAGVLIGLKEVCAGPPPMIIETYAVLLDGYAEPPEPGDEITGLFDRWVGDRAAFLDYCETARNFRMLCASPMRMVRRLLVNDLHAIARAADIKGPFADALADVEAKIPGSPFDDAATDLADEDRAVLISWLCDPLFPLREGTRATAGSALTQALSELWTEPRANIVEQVRRLLRGSDALTAVDEDPLASIADRYLLGLRLEAAFARGTAALEGELRASLGLDEQEVDVDERLADATVGKAFCRMFERGLRVTRAIQGDRVLLRVGDQSLSLSLSLAD